MANLNLSQFGEKLFVADADHTFIWDTAASISKRVSRNSWLNSGTLTSDAPVTISQTWNNAAVAFTGLKVNAAGTSGTNSASGSLLADFQLGGASRVTINKSGETRLWKNSTDYTYLFPCGEIYGYLNSVGVATRLRFDDGGGTGSGSGLFLGNTGIVAWHPLLRTDSSSPDTILLRDGAANTLALRNGANAQTFNVYGTYTSGTSYERLTLSAPSAANAIIGTNKGSGGGTARGLELQTDGVTRMTIPATGGATVNTVAYGNNYINLSPDSINFLLLKRASDSSTVSFYTNSNQSNTLSQGVHSLFELLWSSGAGAAGAYDIGIRRASAGVLQISNTASNTFGFIQGKLRTETAYTATTVVPTGFLTLYDSNGTAYRVPCVAAP